VYSAYYKGFAVSNETQLVKTAQWIDKNFIPMNQQFGPIFLAMAAVWFGLWYPDEKIAYSSLASADHFFWLKQWTPWVSLLAIISAIFGGLKGASASKEKDVEIRRLRKENDAHLGLRNQLEIAEQAIDFQRIAHKELAFEMTSNYLAHIYSDLLNYNDSERISLYLHTDGGFILCGRFALNHEWRAMHREAIADSEGCLGKAWHNGGSYFRELPIDKYGYKEVLKNELGIAKKITEGFKMPSRAYYSVALTHGYKRIGAVVFESTQHGVLVEGDLKTVSDKHQKYLAEMLKKADGMSLLEADG